MLDICTLASLLPKTNIHFLILRTRLFV